MLEKIHEYTLMIPRVPVHISYIQRSRPQTIDTHETHWLQGTFP